MTSHEKRVSALMRLHGMSKSAAEKRARELEAKPKKAVKKSLVRRNPVKQYSVFIVGNGYENRVRGFPTIAAAKEYLASISSDREYVIYPAKVDGYGNEVWRGTTDTLRKKIAKKNPVIPGITARPIKGNRNPVFAVEHAKAKSGPWTTAGIFPNRTLADNYCQAMHDNNSTIWWRVALK